MRKRLALASLSVLIVFLSGCVQRSAEISLPSTGVYRSAQEARDALEQQDRLKDTLRAIVRIEFRHGEERLPVKAALMAKRPQYLRVEAIPLIGPPNLFMTVNGEGLRVFYPAEGKFYTGKATEAHLASFIPLPMAPEEAVSILMGSCPGIVGGETGAKWEGGREEALYRLDLHLDGCVRRSCWIDPATHRLVRILSRNAEGQVVYQAVFRDYEQAGAVSIPSALVLTTGDHNTRSATVRLADVQFSEAPDLKMFRLEPPPGATIIPLE